MSYSNVVQWEELTVVASADITTSFVSAVVTSSQAVAMLVKNGTNGDVVLGIDGTTAKWGFPASSGSAYDVNANAPLPSRLLMLAKGTDVYVKWQGSAPGSPTGNLYIEFMEVS